jgi:hypothetical protein
MIHNEQKIDEEKLDEDFTQGFSIKENFNYKELLK